MSFEESNLNAAGCHSESAGEPTSDPARVIDFRWLELRLSEEATELDPGVTNVPTVFMLRERNLRRRERRARWMSFTASGLAILSLFGWNLHLASDYLHQSPSTSPARDRSSLNVRPIATSDPNHATVTTRWWEPVAVEWVDENGHSLGFAGYVTEERTATETIAPSNKPTTIPLDDSTL